MREPTEAEREDARLEELEHAMKDCPVCGGGGYITVNPTWAKCGPDPQFDEDVRCDRCHGTGLVK